VTNVSLAAELVRYAKTHYETMAPLGESMALSYLKRDIDFWRSHYGDKIADEVAAELRQFVKDTRKKKGRTA